MAFFRLYTLLVVIGFLLPINLGAQQLPDSFVENNRREYEGAALYGFMNGGSDLYLEYGFKKLTVFDLIKGDESYGVEIYEMDSPAGAFGIHSSLLYRCLKRDTLGYYNCLSKYQLQGVKGNLFISVVFPSGNVGASQNAYDIVERYSNSPRDSVALPQPVCAFTSDYSSNILYAKGELGLANFPAKISDLFRDSKDYRVWLVKKGKNGGQLLYLLSFDNQLLESVSNAFPSAVKRFRTKSSLSVEF